MHFTHRFECCFRAPGHDLSKVQQNSAGKSILGGLILNFL